MSARIVLDASAALRIVLGLDEAEVLLDLVEHAAVVSAPDLYASEVANALWKYVVAGELDAQEAVSRYDSALRLIDDFVTAAELGAESLIAASGSRHPVYAMMYVVLARRHGSTILTRDRKLRRAADRLQVAAI